MTYNHKILQYQKQTTRRYCSKAARSVSQSLSSGVPFWRFVQCSRTTSIYWRKLQNSQIKVANV